MYSLIQVFADLQCYRAQILMGDLNTDYKRFLTSIIRDFMSPSSGPLILNICVAPLENLKATCLLERTDPAFLVSLVRVIFPLVPFSVTKTCKILHIYMNDYSMELLS